MPRCGSANITAPDGHNQNEGARGCDGFYADLDGAYSDTATFNPGNLSTNLAINIPGDYKWDQDFFSSDVEMAFARIDFADITEVSTPEMTLMENYFDKLSNYKNVSAGHYMGENSAFYFGYNNSNDGSYRSLVNISKPQNVFQNTVSTSHNQWVQSNGPFKIYMQNVSTPSIGDWQTYGMNATVYTSDQSYWGFGDVPQPGGVYSRIRTLIGVEDKCLIALWTTTGLNILHQACNGLAFGLALKDIINHNTSNQYLEKPPQQYDTQDWWNRTHFEMWGDPTINLYQTSPPSNIFLSEVNGNAQLNWNSSIDPDVIGYHIYESSSEFGIYNRITTSLVVGNSFVLNNYQVGHWYMVKAVKIEESGCGRFLQPSLGKEVQGNLILALNSYDKSNDIYLSPNPTNGFINVKSDLDITTFKITSLNGVSMEENTENKMNFSVDVSNLESGLYFI